MCQLIMRCPIRDSSSAATSAVAEVAVSKVDALNDPNGEEISNEMIIDDDNIDEISVGGHNESEGNVIMEFADR